MSARPALRPVARPVACPVPDAALGLLWPALWPLLAPAVRRSVDRPAGCVDPAAWLMGELRAGNAQPWMVCARSRPIAAVITRVMEHDDGERRCLLWLIGGRGARGWADAVIAEIERWARSQRCVALWGCGRRGWARLVEPRGFRRIADVEGQPAWERRMA